MDAELRIHLTFFENLNLLYIMRFYKATSVKQTYENLYVSDSFVFNDAKR